MSELARVLAQIDLEVESMNRIFHGSSIMASHEAITARMERLSDLKTQLDPHFAGQGDESMRVFLTRLERIEPRPLSALKPETHPEREA